MDPVWTPDLFTAAWMAPAYSCITRTATAPVAWLGTGFQLFLHFQSLTQQCLTRKHVANNKAKATPPQRPPRRGAERVCGKSMDGLVMPAWARR